MVGLGWGDGGEGTGEREREREREEGGEQEEKKKERENPGLTDGTDATDAGRWANSLAGLPIRYRCLGRAMTSSGLGQQPAWSKHQIPSLFLGSLGSLWVTLGPAARWKACLGGESHCNVGRVSGLGAWGKSP